jgi:hypothetical protein
LRRLVGLAGRARLGLRALLIGLLELLDLLAESANVTPQLIDDEVE